MKLYSLANKLRSIIKSQKNYQYLLLGATLFILSGFFYFNITNAKEINNSNISSKKIKTIKSITPTSSNSQSLIKPKVNLINITPTDTLIKSTSTTTVDTALQHKLSEILVGTPMENMIESIGKQDKIIAAFLVGIALKESQLGKHSPKLNGQDCYNYWGYRGKRTRMGTGGHTCFDSPEDAVETVAKRLETLAIKQDRDTPQKMLIWKCGNSCKTHSPQSVAKWVKDVSIYFNEINNI